MWNCYFIIIIIFIIYYNLFIYYYYYYYYYYHYYYYYYYCYTICMSALNWGPWQYLQFCRIINLRCVWVNCNMKYDSIHGLHVQDEGMPTNGSKADLTLHLLHCFKSRGHGYCEILHWRAEETPVVDQVSSMPMRT